VTAHSPNIQDLTKLNLSELRDLWRAHVSGPPPSRTPEILRRELAWRLLEREHGVMPTALRRQLDAVGRKAATKANASATRPEVGSTLVKVWDCRTYRVQILENGYLLDGVIYPSLTRVAHKITGVHRSGPRFFELTTSARR